MVKCQVVMDAMERIAPRSLAEEWDNPGLLIGSPAQDIHRILVCLDMSETVLAQAIAADCDMIVAHHPLFFKPLRNLRTDLFPGRMLPEIFAHHIALYAAYTNLDIAAGGVNDVLAARIGLQALEPFAITYREELLKLAVYVPKDYAERVRDAITQAGAGYIGRYSACTFRTAGKGTFRPEAGTHPFLGKEGELAEVDEVRIETILPAKLQRPVVRAMLKAHPYEEAAYDLYPLKNEGKVESLGRIGFLPEAVSVEAFAHQVCAGLRANHVRLVQAGTRMVRKVALCSGSGAEFIGKAAFMGADAYVTGDVKYHDAQQAVNLGMHVIDAGHFATEYPIVPVLAERLCQLLAKTKGAVDIVMDKDSHDFFTVVS